eukprot:9386977-Pyramimonas_sp.AAC.1
MQGQEADLVVAAAARSNDERDFIFLNDPRRLRVLLSCTIWSCHRCQSPAECRGGEASRAAGLLREGEARGQSPSGGRPRDCDGPRRRRA